MSVSIPPSHDLVLTVRNISKDTFGNEPGPARFLSVPPNQPIHPDHRIAPKAWTDAVLQQALPPTLPPTDPPTSHPADRQTGDVLFYVHGYNTDDATAINRHRQLRRDLEEIGYHGAVVTFAWPSAGRPLNYLEDRSDAKQVAMRLVRDGIRRLAKLQTDDCLVNIHVLAHSTGSYVVREAFDDADDTAAIAATNWTVSQTVFIGADIAARSMTLGDSKSRSLVRHSVRLTNYQNPHDSVLKLSNTKRLGVAPRLGRVGLPQNAPENCVNLRCDRYWSNRTPTPENASGHPAHSWHIGDPVFTQDLLHTLRGDIDRHEFPTRKLTDLGLELQAPQPTPATTT